MSWLSSVLGTATGGLIGDPSQQQNATGSQSQLYGTMASQYQQYFPQLMSNMSSLAANPMGNTVNSQIGQFNDSIAPAGQNAVDAAQNDLVGRGFSGSNTLAPSEVGQMRQSQASDLANYGRNLNIQNQQMKFGDLGQMAGLVSGQGQNASTGLNALTGKDGGLQQIQNTQGQDMSGLASIASMFF